MHVDPHAITPAAADDRRHNHQSVLGDKVPYASFLFGVVRLGCGLEVELERIGAGDEE